MNRKLMSGFSGLALLVSVSILSAKEIPRPNPKGKDYPAIDWTT